jgi:hypothetical protein
MDTGTIKEPRQNYAAFILRPPYMVVLRSLLDFYGIVD